MNLEEELRSVFSSGSVVVLGLGNDLRADDGAGTVLARRLLRALNSSRRVTIVSAGSSPENYLGGIMAARPDAVVLVDAADWGAGAGEISLLDADSLSASRPSTHSISPSLLMKMLSLSSGGKILLLAIQPKTLALGGEMSPEVEGAIARLEEILVDAVKETERRPASCRKGSAR